MELNTYGFRRRSPLTVSEQNELISWALTNSTGTLKQCAEDLGYTVSRARTNLDLLGFSIVKKALLAKQKIILEDALAVEIERCFKGGGTIQDAANILGLSYGKTQGLAKKYKLGVGGGWAHRTHGTPSMYNYFKCRCDVCVKANGVRCGKQKEERITNRVERTPHGTMSGYWNWNCRCEPCKDVGAEVQKMRTYTSPTTVTRKHERWTESELEAVKSYGKTAKEIATSLGRTVSSVNTARAVLKRRELASV